MTMNFNLYALASPSTQEDFIALLDEALRMVDELTEMTLESTRLMEAAKKASEPCCA